MKKASKKISVRLSHKLSGMLKQAVADKNAVAKLKRYRLNMGHWHTPTSNGEICEVCMAGATLVQRGNGVTRFKRFNFFNTDSRVTPRTAAKMRAINEMRMGEMRQAFLELKSFDPNFAQTVTLDLAGDIIARSLVGTNVGELAPDHIYLEAAAILAEAGL